MRRTRISVVAAGAALALGLTACGGDEPVEPTDTTAQDDTAGQDDTSDQPGSDDGAAPDDGAAAGDDGASAIEVDVTALPSEPSGFATLVEDLCAVYAVAELDAFFGGAGGLAASEPRGSGCSWSVEGLPRSHYVDIERTDEGSVSGILEGDRVDVDGVAVHLQRGPSDAYATVPTPEGDFLVVHVHGDFEVDGRPLDGALDPAALGLAENLVGRF